MKSKIFELMPEIEFYILAILLIGFAFWATNQIISGHDRKTEKIKFYSTIIETVDEVIEERRRNELIEDIVNQLCFNFKEQWELETKNTNSIFKRLKNIFNR